MPTKKATSKHHSPEFPITVINESTCATSSGKSTLTYQVGTDDTAKIYLKIADNNGGGYWSLEWVSFSDIQSAIEAWPQDQGITSMAFRQIFRGKSANTPGFLAAVLVAEGILERVGNKKRVHQACDPAVFLAHAKELRKEAGMAPHKKTRPRAKTAPKTKAKAPRKTPARSRKGK